MYQSTSCIHPNLNLNMKYTPYTEYTHSVAYRQYTSTICSTNHTQIILTQWLIDSTLAPSAVQTIHRSYSLSGL